MMNANIVLVYRALDAISLSIFCRFVCEVIDGNAQPLMSISKVGFHEEKLYVYIL